MSKRATAVFVKNLFLDTFRHGGTFRNAMLEVEDLLCTKSWLVHVFVTLSKIVYPIFGQAYWQKATTARENRNPKINYDFVDMIDPYLDMTIIAWIALNVVIDLIIWRRRKLARYLVYIEMLGFI